MSFTVKLTLIDSFETLNALAASVRTENELFFSKEPNTKQKDSSVSVRLISEEMLRVNDNDYSLQYTIGPLTKLNTLENTIIDLLEHLDLSVKVFSEFTGLDK